MSKRISFLLLLLLLIALVSFLPNILFKPRSGVVEYQVGVCIDLNADQNCTAIDAAAPRVSIDLYLRQGAQHPTTTLITDGGGLTGFTLETSFKDLDPFSRLTVHEIIFSGMHRGCPRKDATSIRILELYDETNLTWKIQDIFPIPLCLSGPQA